MPGQILNKEFIREIASRVGVDVDDPERMAILSQTEPCVVQAAPGSGKTTMLVAKLAVLASQWTEPHYGICILAHTNVAYHEIKRRLRRIPELNLLFDHPHFLGTIQGFVDSFLALPYLRQMGVEITAIDDGRCAAAMLAMAKKQDISTVRAWLSARRKQNQGNVSTEDLVWELASSLRFASGAMEVTSDNQRFKNGFPGPHSDTGRALRALKHAATGAGFFRFCDMFAIAEKCLATRPYVLVHLARRFPWAFVDELQDTSSTQGRVLSLIFGRGQVYQRFGDLNQSIFDHGGDDRRTGDLFSCNRILDLSSTHRFGERTAEIASRLTTVHRQILRGCGSALELQPTLIAFDKQAVRQVVDRFGELVVTGLGMKEVSSITAKVVGARRNPAETAAKWFPNSVLDYVGTAGVLVRHSISRQYLLLGYVYEAMQMVVHTKSYAGAHGHIIGGLVALLRYSRLPEEGAAVGTATRSSLMRSLRNTGHLEGLKEVLWLWLSHSGEISNSEWTRSCAKLLHILQEVLNQYHIERFRKFLAWKPRDEVELCGVQGDANSSLDVPTSRGTLAVEIGSIHSVKGETHDATLVLETCINKKFDLKSLLPVFCGTTHGSELAGEAAAMCRRIFVAITRPRSLVCIAILRDHLEEQWTVRMQERGWRIERLS
jgi:ATP-dependent DNA helicase UvrD/PcrA